ncbi:MAG: hypothetical protein AB7E31_15515 [Desulfitobacterium sp.]
MIQIRKDRYTILSKLALETLRNYAKKVRLQEWLFPGEVEGTHLSERSAKKYLKMHVKKQESRKRLQFTR